MNYLRLAFRSFFILAVMLASVPGILYAAPEESASYDREADAHDFTIFLSEGGWCWFQDPRAIILDDKVVAGGVQGNGSGDAVVGVYDLAEERSLGRIVLHKNFQHDDHNAPAFYPRSDGSLLAVYALHGNDHLHRYRISARHDYTQWGEEQTFKHNNADRDTVTYMNLYAVEKEAKLYNFFRGIEFNPCFITSTDEGQTWAGPTHFIRSEVSGRHRPYTRFAGNGTDTIAVSFTDAHPYDFGNSLYYAAFRDGKFYRAGGELIKDLRCGGPLKPSEAERVFLGGGGPRLSNTRSADRSAWTSSIVLDEHGHPHIGYTLYESNSDHRYRLAQWNGRRWVDREIAFGGNHLYDSQWSYTGLVTLDPSDPTHVVISSDVDPSTGEDTNSNHEIYRATIGADDDRSTIRWEPVTKNSPVDNLRPVVVAGDGYRVLLWLRGDYQSYVDYQLDVVGIVEQN